MASKRSLHDYAGLPSTSKETKVLAPLMPPEVENFKPHPWVGDTRLVMHTTFTLTRSFVWKMVPHKTVSPIASA